MKEATATAAPTPASPDHRVPLPPDVRAILTDFTRKSRPNGYTDGKGHVLVADISHYESHSLSRVARRGLIAWHKRCQCATTCVCPVNGYHITVAGELALETGLMPAFLGAEIDQVLADVEECHREYQAAIDGEDGISGCGMWCGSCETLSEIVRQLRAELQDERKKVIRLAGRLADAEAVVNALAK